MTMSKSKAALYAKYQAELDKLIDNHWHVFKSAPVRRGWDRVFGMQIPGKSDLTRALQTNIRELSGICERLTGKALWAEEEEVTLKGKRVD